MTKILKYTGPPFVLHNMHIQFCNVSHIAVYECGSWMICEPGVMPEWCPECSKPLIHFTEVSPESLTRHYDLQAWTDYKQKAGGEKESSPCE